MFEYNGFCLRVYGFIKIEYLDENKVIFKYKRKKLLVIGNGLKAFNLIDRSLEIKGIIDIVKIDYEGGKDD